MFEDIAQMEKEIETFRKNIAASSELINGIAELTEATKKQKESFKSSSEALVEKLDACIDQFKADHNNALQSLESKNAAVIDELKQTIAANMKDWLLQLETAKTAIEDCKATIAKTSDEQIKNFSDECGRIISEMQSDLASQQSAYLTKLEETDKVISGYQTEAENKYNSFVQRLEATNVDQIFKEVQELKKSIQTKFIILMAGVGAAVVAAIVSIVIK